ncbi:hypothetical protein GCK72_025759 [Caenorhabditis remanei]|uniref:SH2 domain-containing protein n=1 Tax=Caenorhabditis remanei TaxID=31234 RepID=A0A6A5G3L6_CAERE|nr:hypothetical protein GCK72_025759 [Caenorhabditis remanei]KAF1749292.1 hypothetical protein GCK72_025759 [Caenorhabditis remanei]
MTDATDSIANNPVSSWGHKSENAVNSSGVRFSVKVRDFEDIEKCVFQFMGYVPMPRSIQHRNREERDALVRLFINTVVASNSSDQYKEFMQQGIVGPFVSVHELDVFLNIANFTLTFFHIKDGRTFLLGRYMNDQISHYKWTEIDGRFYLGIIMKTRQNDKRECNVIMLDNQTATNELIQNMKTVDGIDHPPTSKLEARLRSTQDYAYRIHMLACFHGQINHEEACRRLSKIGDFLIRESCTVHGQYAISYQSGSNSYDKALINVDNINLFKQFQVQESYLKTPVPRPRH